jgi:magnesium transporter
VVAIAGIIAMRSNLPLPSIVPSSALLKFLRSQSESICFFSSNPRGTFTFDHAAPGQLHPRGRKASSRPGRLSPNTETPKILEAGFLNFDYLFPHLATPSRNISARTPRTATRGGALYCARLLGGQRAASSGKKWHQKLWGVRSGKPLEPDDLPTSAYGSEETGDTSMFSLGRHISAKAAAQPKLRCTELDENGNVSMASGEFKKSELIAKVCRLIPDYVTTVLNRMISMGFYHEI